MKKSILQKLFNITVIFVCLFFVTNMFSGCSLFGSKKGFDVTGRIVDDYGVAVEGVKIESDYGTTYTNSQGVYSFSKVKNGIIVTPSIDKYKFAVESKSITNGKDNADFVAYKEYTVSGKVENNGIARPDAELVISSLSGTFYANTDDNGEFKVAGVAGETTISCLETGVQFYPVKANITNPNVVINTTSNLTLKFSFDTTNVDYNQIRLFIDDSMVGINSNEMTFDVHYNSKIKLVSDYYDFNKPEFNISSLNQIEEIEVYKKYDVVGKVQSGKTNIAGASVRIAGKEVAVSDENGNFEIYGLSKTNELSIVFDGLTFNKVTISQFDTVANFNGTKSVYLIFDCDHRNLGDVSISHDKIKKVDDTTCILSEVCLGDEIELSSSVYNLSETNVLISVENLYSVSCHALYNLNVGVSGEISNENDFEYLLDGSPVSVDAFGSLFGKHTVSASYKDYKFETYDVDFENVNVNIEYLIPYSVTFLVQSGNVLISNVLVELNGEEFYADSNGNIVFDKVYGENEFVISAENYNSQSINVNSATNQTINLSYNVNGIVQTGTNAVTMAKVYVDGIDSGIETDTNGEFVLLNIFGSHEISVVKNNYNFQMQEQVCHAESLNFNGNYKIFGTLSDEESVVVGGNIYLVDAENNRQIAVSDNNGYYEFNGLTEKYLLYTMDASGNFKLKPNSYSVSAGGKFDFSLSGFKVAGKIMSGNLPVAYARVTATLESEIMTTYTNANGEYCFELVASDCVVSVSKDGYVFSDDISVSEDNENINFTASYMVYGKVVSGLTAVANVNVVLNGNTVAQTDSEGNFIVSGLVGQQTVSFEKQGFVFTDALSVQEFGNHEVQTKANVSVQVKTGNILVSGFKVYNGTEFVGSQSGEEPFSFVANLGDEITFEKTGFTFEKFVVSDTGLFDVQSTYSISGKVSTGGSMLSNVILKYGETYAQTNAIGEFTINGLVGEVEISFILDGYKFNNIIVKGHKSNLSINGTYSVSGIVKVGDKVLSNVKVTCTDVLTHFEVFTDENGMFNFSSVSGRYSLSFEKESYTFENFSGLLDKTVEVRAFYQISGKVLTGNSPLNIDVTLKLSNGVAEIIRADSEGNFTFTNIDGLSTISVLVNGYTLKSMKLDETGETIGLDYEFSDSLNGLILNMSYAITLNLDISSGVEIYLNDELYCTNQSKQIKIDGLEGIVNVKFVRKNTTFSLNNIPVSAPSIINVTSFVYYDISGVVRSDSGVAASFVQVKSGTKSTYTDENGRYTLNGVAGEVVVEKNLQNRYTKSITRDGVYDLVIKNNDFAYMLYQNAYENLDNAASFQIETTGVVTPKTNMSGPSNVRIISKKDNNGNFIRQHVNYGTPVAGVDPRVSLVTARIDGQWYYQQIIKDDVNANFTANHTAGGLSRVSESEFASIYGAPINCYLYYNISFGVCTFNNVSINGNGNYTFTMTLSNEQSVWKNYATHSHKLMSAQTMNSFKKIEFIFEITKEGWIVGIQNNEIYNVKASAVGITLNMDVEASIYHKYYTQSANIKIDDINISNDVALNNSLAISSQSTISNYNLNASDIDIVSHLIYG